MNDQQHDDAQPARMRASDSEREEVIELLNRHAGEGRLTLEELSERIERAYTAKTQSELVPLTRDLPTSQPGAEASTPAPASRRKPLSWDVAILGGNERQGRFRIKDTFTALALMGGSDIDLRHAEIDGDEITITVVALMGGSTIYVPDTVEVEVGGFSIMGGDTQRGSHRQTPPGAPVLRINVYTLMGGSEIWRLPAETRGKSLKEAKKLAKRVEKGDDPRGLSS